MNRDFMLLLMISFICGVLLHSILIDYDILEATGTAMGKRGTGGPGTNNSGGQTRPGYDPGADENKSDDKLNKFKPNDLTQGGNYQCLWEAQNGVRRVNILDGKTVTREQWFDLWNPDKKVNRDRHKSRTCIADFTGGKASGENNWGTQVYIGGDKASPCNSQVQYYCDQTKTVNDLRGMFQQIRNGTVPDFKSPTVQIDPYPVYDGVAVSDDDKTNPSAPPRFLPGQSRESGTGSKGGSSPEGSPNSDYWHLNPKTQN